MSGQRAPRTYTLAVKKGGQWLYPGVKVTCPRREAIEALKSYIKRSVAQEGFMAAEDGRIIVRIRPEIIFRFLEGERS